MSELNPQPGQKHIHLDPVGGVAGDMFIAAVLAAFPDLQDGMVEAIRAAGLPAAIGILVDPHRDHALTGLRFAIKEADGQASHQHRHRPFSDIRRQLQHSGLATEVKEQAIAIFTLLAQAEARVHGMSVEEVSFHELGEWDSIADIVGAAFLITRLHATWSVGPLPLGGGRVASAHGSLPVPAPATIQLLRGFDCFDDGVDGERVTPTGAAILCQLGANRARDPAVRRLLRDGTGFGARVLPGLSNVLRLLAFAETASSQEGRDCIAEIVFEVDDQTAEDLAIGLDTLRAHPAVTDVLQMSALGKKGRLATQVRVLADPLQLRQVCDACFEQTSTIGLRYQVLDRFILQRRELSLDLDGKSIGVKAVHRGTAMTVKAESDDIAASAGGYNTREGLRYRVHQTYGKGEAG